MPLRARRHAADARSTSHRSRQRPWRELILIADQVVAHLRKTHGRDDDKIRNVLLYHQRQIADLVHAQMQKHTWQDQTSQ
jgi:hypothetical protein